MWIVERAVSPVSGLVTPLIIDCETFQPYGPARDFSRYLRGAGRSPETSRAYVPRLARFLNWCAEHATDPLSVTVIDLSRYRHDLEVMKTRKGQPVGPATIAGHLTAVTEFLRFCSAHGHADPQVAARLSRPRFLRYLPANFDAGELGQRRFIESPSFASGSLRAHRSRCLKSRCRPSSTNACPNGIASSSVACWTRAAEWVRCSGFDAKICTCCQTQQAWGVRLSAPMFISGRGRTIPMEREPRRGLNASCRCLPP